MTYTWDNNGNLLSDGVNSHIYNTANQLISMAWVTVTTEHPRSEAG